MSDRDERSDSGGTWTPVILGLIAFALLGAGLMTFSVRKAKVQALTEHMAARAEAEAAGEEQRVAAMTPEEREKAARAVLMTAAAQAYPEKNEALRIVAHLYWETEAAASALEHLVLGLTDHARDHAAAWEEVRFFEKSMAQRVEYLSASNMLFRATEKELAREDLSGERRAELQAVRDTVRSHVVKHSKAFAAREEYRNDYAVQLQLGYALQADGDFEGAAAAFANIDGLEPAPRAEQRFDALIRRADLLRSKLDRPDEALEVFRRANELTGELDVQIDRKWGEYVRKAIRELSDRGE